MKLDLDFTQWFVGVGVIRGVPVASEEYLCDHYEQCVMVRLGPLILSYWFPQKAP